MNKLNKINANVKRKQRIRLAAGIIGILGGGIMYSGYLIGEGIRISQETMNKFFPEEYASMSKKAYEILNKK